MPIPPQSQHPGKTLLELLMTLLIISLLCALALPLLQQPLQELRASTLKRQLHASLANARAIAITQRQRIGVCPSSDGRSCGARWDQGWILFQAGTNKGGPLRITDILRHESGQRGRALLARGTQGRPVLYFNADGRSGNSNQTVTICLQGRTHSQVIINIGGRVRSKRPRMPRPC